MAKFSVEAYDGAGVRLYWDDNACCNTCAEANYIYFSGNQPFFRALVMQLIYFAGNDFSLPAGSHVHYDESFGCRYSGPELVVEVIPDKEAVVDLDVSELLVVHVDVPRNIDKLLEAWKAKAKVIVTYDSDIYLLANRQGLMFIAAALLFLLENNNAEICIPSKSESLDGWKGHGMAFRFIDSKID